MLHFISICSLDICNVVICIRITKLFYLVFTLIWFIFFRCSVSENAVMNDPVSSERDNLHHDDQGWNARTEFNTEEGLYSIRTILDKYKRTIKFLNIKTFMG